MTTYRTCRLKCDRQTPCGSCIKRGDASSCSQSQNNPNGDLRRETRSRDSEAHSRLQKLEQMVTGLMQTPKKDPIDRNKNVDSDGTTLDKNLNDLSVNNVEENSAKFSSGHLELNGCEMNYLGGTHWATILENVSYLYGK